MLQGGNSLCLGSGYVGIHPLRIVALLGVLFTLLPPVDAAPLSESSPSLRERLAQLDPATITPLMVEQARLEEEALRLRLEEAQLDRKAAETELAALKERLREMRAALAALRATPHEGGEVDPKIAGVEEELGRLQETLEREQQRDSENGEREKVAREALATARQWHEALAAEWRGSQDRSRKEAYADVEARLLTEERRHQQRADALSATLRTTPPEAEMQRALLAVSISDAQERARLQRVILRRHRLADQFESLREAEPAEKVEGVARALITADGLSAELTNGQRLLSEKALLLEQQRALLKRREAATPAEEKERSRGELQLQELEGLLGEEAKRYAALLAEVESWRALLLERYEQLVSRGLGVRQPLPLSPEAIEGVITELRGVPAGIGHYANSVAKTFADGLSRLDAGSWLMMLLVAGAVVVAAWRLRRLLLLGGGDAAVSPQSTLALLGAITLRLLPWVVPLILLMGLAYAAELPASQLRLLAVLAALWLSIAALKALGWIFLVHSGGEEDGARLYHALRRVGWGVGSVATLLLIAHWSALPQGGIDLLDRLFFVLLLFVVPLLSSVRTTVEEGLTERYEGRAWLPTLRLILLLVPILVLFAAVAGVAGYLNLSRLLLGSVGWVALVSAGWLFSMGLLRDATNGLKNFAVSHSHHGLLWAQGVIDPLRKLGNLLLMVAAFVVLFRLLGGGVESAAIRVLEAVLELPLLKVGETEILVEGVLLSLLVLMVVVWLGRWAREITYRWLYTPVTDLGIRQSLSVFTQYAVVIIGGVIALQALDIDLTAFAVFAGALGVGLGLGLQGVANNFVSGLLLLAERPLRTGDMVMIGGTEGEVTRFGIRSLTIKTWENQEMIIPNAEVVSSSFTNWTHSDNVMRTMFILGVSYDDDPHLVRRLISEVVAAHPAVLSEPSFKVYLWEFGESSVNFRVQYFTDLRAQGRLDVLSEVLFEVWDRLKAHGVSIPFPQRDLHVKSWPVSSGEPGARGEGPSGEASEAGKE